MVDMKYFWAIDRAIQILESDMFYSQARHIALSWSEDKLYTFVQSHKYMYNPIDMLWDYIGDKV